MNAEVMGKEGEISYAPLPIHKKYKIKEKNTCILKKYIL